MKKIQYVSIFALALAVMMAGLVAVSMASEQQAVIAWVSDDLTIETDDGEVLDVADTDVGNDLLRHVGKKVEVVGEITQIEGIKTIRVASYTVIEE